MEQTIPSPGDLKRTVSIVIPVYFNAESLPHLFSELADFEEKLSERNLDLELILVNDGSGDKSLDILLDFKEKRSQTKVISLSRNFGTVAASKTGFKFVTGDVFGILSADLQDPTDQVLKMIDCWLEGEKLTVSRRVKRDDPLTTRMFSWLYYAIAEKLVVKGYPVGGYDLMLMDKVMLPFMDQCASHTNPNIYSYWLGFEPKILEYHRKSRRFGKSRWTFRKKIGFFINTITGFSVKPIRILSAIGIVTALISFLYGVNLTIEAVLGNVPVQGFATLAVLISFFSGLILIMLGVIGEYIWRIFEAVNDKPEAVIEEMHL